MSCSASGTEYCLSKAKRNDWKTIKWKLKNGWKEDAARNYSLLTSSCILALRANDESQSDKQFTRSKGFLYKQTLNAPTGTCREFKTFAVCDGYGEFAHTTQI